MDYLQKICQDYDHKDSQVQWIRDSSGMETQIIHSGSLGYIENKKTLEPFSSTIPKKNRFSEWH